MLEICLSIPPMLIKPVLLQAPELALPAPSCPARIHMLKKCLQGANDAQGAWQLTGIILQLRAAAEVGNADPTVLQSQLVTALEMAILRLSRDELFFSLPIVFTGKLHQLLS